MSNSPSNLELECGVPTGFIDHAFPITQEAFSRVLKLSKLSKLAKLVVVV